MLETTVPTSGPSEANPSPTQQPPACLADGTEPVKITRLDYGDWLIEAPGLGGCMVLSPDQYSNLYHQAADDVGNGYIGQCSLGLV